MTQHGHARLVWVDVAKAMAIVLVVHYHLATNVPLLWPGLDGWAWQCWVELAEVARPVRMPAFFLVSGLLAAAAVHRSWSTLYATRIVRLAWPFLLWSVALTAVIAARGAAEPLLAIGARLPVIAQGGTGYWYLSALVLFLVVARCGRQQPRALLAVAAVLWCLAPWVPEMLPDWLPHQLSINIGRWSSYLVWFVVGAFWRPLVLRLMDRPWWQLTLPAGAGFITAWIASQPWQTGSSVAVLGDRVLNVTGVLLLLGLSLGLAQLRSLARVAAYLAARTLQVYLVHALVIYGLLYVMSEIDAIVPVTQQPAPWFVLVAVPVAVTGLVLGSTVLGDLVDGTRLAWLFTPPSWFSRPRARSPQPYRRRRPRVPEA